MTATLDDAILAITQKVGKIKATGKGPFNGVKALSIGDVEDALRPLLIEQKVLIRFRERDLTRVDRDWKVDITAIVRGAGEEWMDDWSDSGGTPAAAYSFARKSYLKALFHIADTDDTSQAPAPRNTAANRAAANGGTPTPRLTTVSAEKINELCPECGDGDLLLKTLSDGRRFIGCSHYPACKFNRTYEQVPA